MNYIGAFEQTLAEEAQRHRVDGVICGHIHHAVMHDNFGIRYMNCGDWVESCTALAEHDDGHFEIIRVDLIEPTRCRRCRTRTSRSCRSGRHRNRGLIWPRREWP